MESANLHYKHQQQQQLGDESSSPFDAPPFYQVEASRAAWSPNTILSNGEFNPNVNVPPMTQEMDFGSSFATLSAHDQVQLARIKEELSSSSVHHSDYPRFTDMLNSPSSSSIGDFHLLSNSSDDYLKNDQEICLIRTFSSGCQINGFQLPAAAGGGVGGFYSSPPQKYYCPTSATSVARGTFSQILPTINISELTQTAASSNSSLMSSSSLSMNLESLDLFNSTRFSAGYSQSPHDHLGLFKTSLPYSLQNMQLQLSPGRPSSCPTNVTSSSPFHNNGVSEVKRPSSSLETKPPQAAPKKSRLDSRSSCPPFKVRKEKLGDRIAALQQLVAPFGKTDTASVLMEAIGYIKFLQNQVETLSVPYMKSSRNRTKKTQGGLGDGNGEEAEGMRDLRTRGLCLVPLSCLSYVTDGGGGVWPPPNFSGFS
ncbi:LOW QUALITY PROTEIN: transcription factor bHLH110 [Daucus carota subsp. sativus]|uniref:LOW QUALITY PROTEIN: transcription factor bHLH110 n=1 Tax=Daucus carota subsp. sativus TaxID=79200 RepID=UPI0030835AB0